MIANKSKGLISFTSSPGGFMGSPMASMYSSTKSFVTLFATSIAGELHDDGIDVTVVHPSPTNTGFYSNAGLLSALKFFQKTAVSPDDIADVLFKYAGRSVIVDHGYYTFMNRIALKILDITALTDLLWVFVKGQGYFKALKSDGLKKMANKTK
jgi:short-subunit dehydrogenase